MEDLTLDEARAKCLALVSAAQAAARLKDWPSFYKICQQHDRLALQYQTWRRPGLNAN